MPDMRASSQRGWLLSANSTSATIGAIEDFLVAVIDQTGAGIAPQHGKRQARSAGHSRSGCFVASNLAIQSNAIAWIPEFESPGTLDFSCECFMRLS